jgi:hypothetical protein
MMPRKLPTGVKKGATNKRAPDWLRDLAEAVSGTRLTAHGYQPTTAEPSLTELEKKIPASSKRGD